MMSFDLEACPIGNAPFAEAYREVFNLLLDEIQLHAHLQKWRLIWLSVSVLLIKVIHGFQVLTKES